MSKDISEVSRPFRIKSTVWGQSLDVGPVENGIIFFVASDFDSGETVRVGMNVDCCEQITAAMNESIAEGAVKAKQKGSKGKEVK